MVTIKNTKRESIKKGIQANKELVKYLKDNNLDPTKDWTKDKKHGKKISELVRLSNLAEKKAADKTGSEPDKPKKLKKPETKPSVKKVTKAPNIYDYPEVDGQPMSPELKKKFRTKMRSLLKSNMEPKTASKKALEFIMEGMDKVVSKETTTKDKIKEDKKEVKSTKSTEKSKVEKKVDKKIGDKKKKK